MKPLTAAGSDFVRWFAETFSITEPANNVWGEKVIAAVCAIEIEAIDSTEQLSPESHIPAGQPCPICGPEGHGGHEDNSYGDCVLCYEYVPHSDVAYRRVPFPCAVALLEQR